MHSFDCFFNIKCSSSSSSCWLRRFIFWFLLWNRIFMSWWMFIWFFSWRIIYILKRKSVKFLKRCTVNWSSYLYSSCWRYRITPLILSSFRPYRSSIVSLASWSSCSLRSASIRLCTRWSLLFRIIFCLWIRSSTTRSSLRIKIRSWWLSFLRTRMLWIVSFSTSHFIFFLRCWWYSTLFELFIFFFIFFLKEIRFEFKTHNITLLD